MIGLMARKSLLIDDIIDRCGGIKKVAAGLNLSENMVYKMPKMGIRNADHFPLLIEMARRNKQPISADDIVKANQLVKSAA